MKCYIKGEKKTVTSRQFKKLHSSGQSKNLHSSICCNLCAMAQHYFYIKSELTDCKGNHVFMTVHAQKLVVVETFKGGDNQIWSKVDNTLVSKDGDESLVIGAKGEQVEVSPANASQLQFPEIKPLHHFIQDMSSTFVCDVKGGETTSGTPIIASPAKEPAPLRQQWKFEYIGK